MKIPPELLEPSPQYFLRGLIGIGAISAGIYRGYTQAKGILISPGLENMLFYGPEIIGAINGWYTGGELGKIKSFKEEAKAKLREAGNSEEQTEAIIPTFSRFIGVTSGIIGTSLGNVLGYYAGKMIASIG